MSSMIIHGSRTAGSSRTVLASERDLDDLDVLGLVPGWIKSAKCKTVEVPEGLPRSAFADPVRKRYPCHTKIACYLSNVNYLLNSEDQSQQDKEVEQSLYKFAKTWGLVGELELAKRKLGMLKQASSQPEPGPDREDCLRIIRREDGTSDWEFPVRNAAECLKAAQWLLEYRDEFDFPSRRQMAQRLLDKIDNRFPEVREQLSEEHVDVLRKQAGYGLPDLTALTADLRERAFRLERIPQYCELAAPLRKLASDLPRIASKYTTQDWIKMAEMLDQVDGRCGFKPSYGKTLRRPEETCFDLDPEAARDFLKKSVCLSTGDVFGPDFLEAIQPQDILTVGSMEDLNNIRGGNLSIQLRVEKVAEFVEGLPPVEAHVICTRVRSRGIEPVWHIRPARQNFSQERWESIQSVVEDLL